MTAVGCAACVELSRTKHVCHQDLLSVASWRLRFTMPSMHIVLHCAVDLLLQAEMCARGVDANTMLRKAAFCIISEVLACARCSEGMNSEA